ncbi:MAG: ATP-binding protein [Desulfococcaceae bacterium]|jgi:AAA15 family ATPase/GTPase|nr:ATP-binding protein [Desulfococcaceae bacterium]
MIIDFTIKNFRSIKEPVTLSALATNVKEHSDSMFQSKNEDKIKILNTTAVYGPNASGKSNIISAFDVLQDFIVLSTDLKLDEKIKYYQPFKLDKKWADLPTEFEIEFIIENHIRYRYTIVFNSEEIIKELLVFFPKGQEATLFLREKGKKVNFGDYFRGPARSVEKQLLKNNLFLSKCANSNNKVLEEIYLYFKNNIIISDLSENGISLPDFTTQECLKKDHFINKQIISEFLQIADVGIEYLDINKRTFAEDIINFPHDMPDEIKKRIIEDLQYRPQMFHKLFENDKEIGTISFDLAEESAGTVKLYDLAGKILYVLYHGLVFIVDELNNSLHPLLTQHIINLFQNANPNNAQLIFATHDTSLLNPDLLRRDQIWLTEKNQFGATSLYSVSDFDYRKVRSNIPFDKWYLSGRFGALPVIGNFNKWVENAKKKTE